MSSFKEIVTKAVIGKAKKTSGNTFSLEPEEIPNTVLGCWVINHKFNGTKGSSGKVIVNGSFDVNVWYSYNNDTKTAVATEHFTYEDKMNIKLKDGAVLSDASEIIVRSLTQPTVTDVTTEQGVVNLSIEKELGVEIVGNTMIKVSVEEEEDDYEVIEDETQEEEIDEVIQEIDEDYLK